MSTKGYRGFCAGLLSVSFALSLMPQIAHAGFALAGAEDRTSGGHTYLRFPGTGLQGGVYHDLTPSNYYSFRVRCTHSDSVIPNIGYSTDNLTPASSPFQVCNDTGCEVPELDAGTEDLDWSDWSKVTCYLEAKDAPLSGWQTWELADPS